MKDYYRVYYNDKHKSDGAFTFLTNTGKVVTLPYYAYEEDGVLRDAITNEIVTMKRSFESNESLECYIKTKVKLAEVLGFVMLLRDNRVYYYNYVNQILILSGKRENNNSKAEQSILNYYNKVNEENISL